MVTKKIQLFYKITQNQIISPPSESVKKKDLWLKSIQSQLDLDSKIIKVTYEIFNPEVEQQRKFFNGPVVEYYAIQSSDIYEGDVPLKLVKQVRETLLSNILGYEVALLNRTERRRKSSSDFINVQQWNNFLEVLRETEFEPNGYEMPDSDEFWELTKKYGYLESKKIAIKKIQSKIKKKNGIN